MQGEKRDANRGAKKTPTAPRSHSKRPPRTLAPASASAAPDPPTPARVPARFFPFVLLFFKASIVHLRLLQRAHGFQLLLSLHISFFLRFLTWIFLFFFFSVRPVQGCGAGSFRATTAVCMFFGDCLFCLAVRPCPIPAVWLLLLAVVRLLLTFFLVLHLFMTFRCQAISRGSHSSLHHLSHLLICLTLLHLLWAGSEAF